MDQLEEQMRIQERQLAGVRLALVAIAAAALVALRDSLEPVAVLAGLLVLVTAYNLAIPWLLRRFPAREVGIVSTAIDMAAVTVAVYVASDAVDTYLLYALVVLGAALRFGLGASLWTSVVVSLAYVVVILASPEADPAARALLPVRMAYLLAFGVAAGLFSRVVIGRATENARLQQRLAEEERERERAAEGELLSRLARDFGASLDRDETAAAVARGAAPVLGDVSVLYVAQDGRLEAAAAAGADPPLVAGVRTLLARQAPGLLATGAEALVVTETDALGISWVMAVPIVMRGAVLGVLATIGREGDPPDDNGLRLAQSIAERAGPALQNALLWADLQDRMRREQEAQRIKDDFLSIVSHELRTPLTSIQGYSQLLEGRLSGGGETKELSQLRVIRSQVGRMRRLVDDLLDVSRIDRSGGVSIEPADFDLADDLREAVARVQREHATRHFALDVPDRMPVRADRDRVGQVVSNLLDNAVKYSPDGGGIGVSARDDGDEVEVSISDTGVGIPPEHADQVFSRFYQVGDDIGRRRFGGLGLGLYISGAIVEAHGGRIWVTPNHDAGRGSVFAFRIPRTARAGGSTAETAPVDEAPAFVARGRDGGR